VLLYASPAGIVLYWTANNLFSLARNVIVRGSAVRLPARISRALTTLSEQR